MSKVVFKLNKAGVGDLLKSSDASNVCKTYADGIVGAAGDEYQNEQFYTSQRVGWRVSPGTAHAYYSNLKHNTLEIALGTVRK